MYCMNNKISLDNLTDNYDLEAVNCIVQYGLFDEIQFGY